MDLYDEADKHIARFAEPIKELADYKPLLLHAVIIWGLREVSMMIFNCINVIRGKS